MIVPQQERVSHITGVSTYRPWSVVISSILRQITLKQSKQAQQNLEDYFNKNIEIELKYCVFRPRYDQEHNYNIMKNLSKKAGIHFYQQHSNFAAGFQNEKQFYGMRQFLFNVCKANEERLQSNNFYKELRQIHSNGKYKYKGKQLRMDINFDGTRHTFTVGSGWSVMKKQKINENLDLLFCESEFRFSFNKEQKIKFNKQDLVKVLSNTRIAIRIKNITKFQKNDEIEISMSEVLKLSEKKKDFIEYIIQMIDQPEKLSEFIISYFANFYNQISFRTSGKQSSTQLQIQSEVLLQKYQSLARQLEQKQDLIVENFFERMVQDLQSLIWADYTLMKFETSAIRGLYKSKHHKEPKDVGIRFEALRGDYMRNEIREFIGAHRC